MQPNPQNERISEKSKDTVEENIPSHHEFISRSFQTDVSSKSLGLRKRVNFKLNNEDNVEEAGVNAVALRKIFRKTRKKRYTNQLKKYNSADSRRTKIKNVVYNGTFPIDFPLKSRFAIYSDLSSSGSCSGEDMEEGEAIRSLSMRELVQDKNFSMANMRKEFQASLSEFEKFLAKGAPSKYLPTYSIDEPL